jgi:hypothetical protein
VLALANVPTSDGYTTTATLGPLPTAQQLVYVVANASAFMQLAPLSASGTQEDWLPEILVPPTSNVIARVSGARWRSAVPGSPAQIVAQLIQPDDPAPGAGTPFTSTLATSGAVGSGVQIPEVTLAQWPPATPTEQQAVVLILPASFDPVGGKPVRWLCHYDLANNVWHVVGGPPLYVESAPGAIVLALAYANFGPSLVLPRNGDYQIEIGWLGAAALNVWAVASYSVNGGAALDNDSAAGVTFNNINITEERTSVREKAGLVAANNVIMQMRSNGGNNITINRAWLRATPIRIV